MCLKNSKFNSNLSLFFYKLKCNYQKYIKNKTFMKLVNPISLESAYQIKMIIVKIDYELKAFCVWQYLTEKYFLIYS